MIKLIFNIRNLIVGFFLIAGLSGNAQQVLSMEDAISIALRNNFLIRQAGLEIQQAEFKKKNLSAIPKTDVSVLFGQYNSIERGDNNIQVSQSIPFPTTFFKANTLGKALVETQQYKLQSTQNDIIYQVSSVYQRLTYLKAKRELLLREDSLYNAVVTAASLRYKTGESTLLEKASFETQQLEVRNTLQQNDAEIKIHQGQLMALLNAEILIDSNSPHAVMDLDFGLDTLNVQVNPFLGYLGKEIHATEQQKKYEVSKALPDLRVGLFNQTLIGEQLIDGQDVYFGADKRFTGFEVGLSIPLFFGSYKANVKDAGLKMEIAENNLLGYQNKFKSELEQAIQEFQKQKNSLNYYQHTAIPNADLIKKQTQLAFTNGEIDYTTFLLLTNRVVTIHHSYIESILNYNLSIVRLKYLIGNSTQEK